nr:hypothetical protein [Tanacetum cinerariifolium]
MEKRVKWNIEFKDVTSVAHAVADFIERAGMAFGIVARFSKEEEIALGLQIPIWNFDFFVSTHGLGMLLLLISPSPPTEADFKTLKFDDIKFFYQEQTDDND